jgi:AcrR family transcriptional regulator
MARPRDPHLDRAILEAAERRLLDHGYAGLSLEAVAAAAGTTVPAVRRRHGNRAALAAAVVDSLRVEPLPESRGEPRDAALAILRNFARNLRRPGSLALLGSLLAEEARHPELLDRFRERLVGPRRHALRAALEAGGAPDADAAANLLIGAFYARRVSGEPVPEDWAERVLAVVWPPR